MRKSLASSALAIALSTTLVASGTPTLAFAASSSELQAQLSEAQATLQTMSAEAAEAGENLNDTLYQLEQTQTQIDQTTGEITKKQEELTEAQTILSERVASNYKAGGISLLSLVLQSSSFEELVSNIYYADKVSARDAEAIQTVKDVRAELQEKKDNLAALESEQESLAKQQEAQKEELDQRQAEQQAYVDGLSAEVQQKLEEERQAELARLEAERKAAEEAAARAAAEQAANQPSEESNQEESSAEETTSSPTPSAPASTPTPTPQPTPAPSSGDTSSIRQTIVNAAYSQLGVPYVYGACSPGSAFDCSGFTSWCYSQAGIYIPHSSAGQSGYIRSTGSLQPGDLVISAGPEFLMRGMCEKRGLSLIASQVDPHTGRVLGPNCSNAEKVVRFRQAYPEAEIDNFYSDSRNDDPLAALAKRAFFVDLNAGTLTPWPA